MQKPQVAVVMGSDSDWPVMEETVRTLKQFGIAAETSVISAHRSPELAHKYGAEAAGRGLRVIIAGAGGAAHLAGALAAGTSLPVIGVPMDAGSMRGLDALLATVQMPAGVPVATVAIGKPGARNAAVLAAQILALSDSQLRAKLDEHKQQLAQSVAQKSAKVRDAAEEL